MLLLVLVAVLQILRPGIVNERWIANSVKFAIPLALLAGCQTMTMLTGGIDLSVATVATMAGFIMATQAVHHDPAVAILMAFGPALLIGLANGIGVGDLPRPPADHDARHQPRSAPAFSRSTSAR